MELEKAINILLKFKQKINAGKRILDMPNFYRKIALAIETVLKELVKLQKENCILKNRQGVETLKEVNIENLSEVLSPYYIPKKKIEDKKKEYESKHTRDKVLYGTNTYNAEIQLLQELLDNK